MADQDRALESNSCRQALESSDATSRVVLALSMADNDQPPEYVDDAPEYPADKNPSFLDSRPTTDPASFTQEPRGSGLARGLASLSESLRTMTSSFRVKPEPLVIALCEASARGNVNNIASLVASGANTEGRDENRKTPIVRAIEAGQYEAVKCLLDNGASKLACDTAKKLPPLFHATECGDVRITGLLLSYGCNPREKSP